jgi:hypothetical protein
MRADNCSVLCLLVQFYCNYAAKENLTGCSDIIYIQGFWEHCCFRFFFEEYFDISFFKKFPFFTESNFITNTNFWDSSLGVLKIAFYCGWYRNCWGIFVGPWNKNKNRMPRFMMSLELVSSPLLANKDTIASCHTGRWPEMEFLDINLTKVFCSMLFTVPSFGGF